MSDDWHNPLDTILNAVASTIGWAITVPCLAYLGLLAGCALKHPDGCLGMSLEFACWLPVAWIICPIILPAYLVLPLAYWLPLRWETAGSYVTAAVVTILLWTLAGFALSMAYAAL